MPMTTAWRNATGDHSIGKSDIGSLVDVYLALFTGNPGDAGSIAAEVTGTGYARINITALMGAFSAGEATNAAEINFGSPGSDWGTISYVGIVTTASGAASGAAFRYYEQLPSPRVATAGGRPIKFDPGGLTFRHT